MANPKGLAYSRIADSFLVWDQVGAVAGITLREDPLDIPGLHMPVENFHNLAFNGKTNSLFTLNNNHTQLNEFSVTAKGLPQPATGFSKKHDLGALSLQAVQGITFDPTNGFLYLLDQQGTQLVIVAPGAASKYDGLAALLERRVTRVYLASLGYPAMQGIAFNPGNRHIYLSDPIGRKVYEINISGQQLSVFDLSPLNLINPQTLLFAPSVDATDDPNIFDLFILDEGQPGQAAKSGVFSRPVSEQQTASAADSRIVELSFRAPMTLPPGIALLPTTLVNAIDTSNTAWNPSAPDASGIDYWPLTGQLLISDSEVDESPNYFPPAYKNVFFSTLSGTQTSSCSTTTPSRTGYSNEPTGVAVNRNNNRIYFSDDDANKIFEVSLGPDNTYCTADDVVRAVDVGSLYSILDVEDIAYGNNTLFIAGGDDAEVYSIPLGPNGVLGGGDDGAMTHFDTASLGFNILEGIGYNWDNGTLLLTSPYISDTYIGVATITGRLINAYDVSYLSADHREDVTYAPGSQNPAINTLYMTDRGIDIANNTNNPNENDGKIWEVSLPSVPPSSNPLYLSLTSDQMIGGVTSGNEDILKFDSFAWSLFFDGSDLGLGVFDICAFSIVDSDTILMSFSTALVLNRMSVTPRDVVQFDATSLGSVTAGTFSMYFDGSDVGLDVIAESIDSVSLLPDGRVLISTTGNPSVPGIEGEDEDVLAFTPTSLGDVTSGSWAMYFDGSDVGLATTSDEDVDALDVTSNGRIYLSTLGAFEVTGVSGFAEDVFVCIPSSIGSVTVCNYSSSLYFDGSTWGLDANDVDAFDFLTVGLVPTSTPTSTFTATSTQTPSSSDLIFRDGFESGSFSAWSSNSNDLGDLSVSTTAALAGIRGMQALIDDIKRLYVTDYTPNAEPRYRARFYFDPNSIAMTDGNAHYIFIGYDAKAIFNMDFRIFGGSYQIRLRQQNDSQATQSTAWFTISDAPHFIEMEWRAATASGANNGSITLWIDGVQKAKLSGLDNDTRRIDRVQLGVLSGVGAGTLGTYYIDAFESRRQTYIGP